MDMHLGSTTEHETFTRISIRSAWCSSVRMMKLMRSRRTAPACQGLDPDPEKSSSQRTPSGKRTACVGKPRGRSSGLGEPDGVPASQGSLLLGLSAKPRLHTLGEHHV